MSCNKEKEPKKGRNWHDIQEQCLLEKIISDPKYMPIGGSLDGQMANKCDMLFEPLATWLTEETEKSLAARIKEVNKRFNVRMEFTAQAVQSKWSDWQGKYRVLKSKHDVSDYIKVGSTGKAASEDQTADRSANPSIENATKEWKLFRIFHCAFGDKARFCTNKTTDSLTPAKTTNETLGAGPAPAEDIALTKKRKAVATKLFKEDDEDFVEAPSDGSASPQTVRKRARRFTPTQMNAVLATVKDKQSNGSVDVQKLVDEEEKNRIALQEYGREKNKAAADRDALTRIAEMRKELMANGLSVAEAQAAALAAERELQESFKNL
jgi:hypothetical protein